MSESEQTSDVMDERTARWWRCLDLPIKSEERLKLRESYNEKLKAHSADKLDDPLSDSVFEAVCKEVRKDLEAGFYFPEEHPISQAAREGKLDGADVAVGVWLLENTSYKYKPCLGVLAAVIFLQLTQPSSGSVNNVDDEDNEADCFLMFTALVKQMACFLFETDVEGGEGMFDDVVISPIDTMLHSIASKLVSVDPPLFDHIESNFPMATKQGGEEADTAPAASPSVLGVKEEASLQAVGGNSLQEGNDNDGTSGAEAKSDCTSQEGIVDDEVNESDKEANSDELWSKSWVTTLFSRQCQGNPNMNLFRVWDEVLLSIATYTGVASNNNDARKVMDIEAWVDCLAPLMVAMLIDMRPLLLSTSSSPRATVSGNPLLSYASIITSAGEDGGKWSRLLEVSRLIRTPERISTLDPTCKVATFQVGPLGLVLGPVEQDASTMSKKDGKALRVRKFQRIPVNPDGSGGGQMQAEMSGIISIGDILVAVNGVSVSQGLTASGVVDLLKRVGRPVKVSFRTPPAQPPRPPPQPVSSPDQASAAMRQQKHLAQPRPTRAARSGSGGNSQDGQDSYSDFAMSAASSLMDTIDPEVMQGMSQATKGLFAAVGASSAASSAATWLGPPRDVGTPPPVVDKHSRLHENSGGGDGEREHAAILCADDDFLLPLIAGEIYEAVLSAEMHGFQRTRMADGALERVFVRGQLFVSNYRIYFHTMDKVNSQHCDWSIPVHTVERFESLKTDGETTQAISMSHHSGGNHPDMIGRSMVLHCKDGQIRKFSTHRTFGEEQLLADEFHHFQRKFYTWSYGSEDSFARIHAKALDEANDQKPVPPEHSLQDCLSLSADFERLGLASYTKLRMIKQNEINLCLTYPLELVVPAFISNKELLQSAKYRSKQRLPVVAWFDIRTGASISRSSQPLVGMNSKRCFEDEKLIRELAALTFREGMDGPLPCTFFIVDARSKVATRGNQLMGKGVEQTKYYRDARYSTDLRFMNIGNIHACRESFEQLSAITQPGSMEGSTASQGWHGKLDSTGWLGHTQSILRASNFIVETVTRDKCSVLVHCSDGWDRTPQLCATAQLLIDAHYRTLKGFAFLIEKEWILFGHKFSDRCAHSSQQPSEEKSAVFTLWIDCVWQVMRQFPSIFEFNEDLLLALLDHLYSCRFGSFLYNSFIERNKAISETKSIWSWLEQNYESFLNPNYKIYTEGPVLPSTNPLNMVLWEKFHQRFDLTKLPLDPEKLNPTTYYN